MSRLCCGKWEGDKRGSQQGIRKVTIKCGGIDCQNRPIETTAHPTLKMRLIPLIDTDKSSAKYSNDLWIHNDILSWSKNRPPCAEFRLPNDLLLSMVAKEVYWWVCANDDGLSKASNHKCREEIINDEGISFEADLPQKLKLASKSSPDRDEIKMPLAWLSYPI